MTNRFILSYVDTTQGDFIHRPTPSNSTPTSPLCVGTLIFKYNYKIHRVGDDVEKTALSQPGNTPKPQDCLVTEEARLACTLHDLSQQGYELEGSELRHRLDFFHRFELPVTWLGSCSVSHSLRLNVPPVSCRLWSEHIAKQICLTPCHRLLILPVQSGCGLSFEGFEIPLLPLPVNHSFLLCVCQCFLENLHLTRWDCHQRRCCHGTAACSSTGINIDLVQTIKMNSNFIPTVSLCINSYCDGYWTQRDVFVCCSLARLQFLILPVVDSWPASLTQHLSASRSITARRLLHSKTEPKRKDCLKMHS